MGSCWLFGFPCTCPFYPPAGCKFQGRVVCSLSLSLCSAKLGLFVPNQLLLLLPHSGQAVPPPGSLPKHSLTQAKLAALGGLLGVSSHEMIGFGVCLPTRRIS